jgi:hypothetical protein
MTRIWIKWGWLLGTAIGGLLTGGRFFGLLGTDGVEGLGGLFGSLLVVGYYGFPGAFAGFFAGIAVSRLLEGRQHRVMGRPP